MPLQYKNNKTLKYSDQFSSDVFLKEMPALAQTLRTKESRSEARKAIWRWLDRTQYRAYSEEGKLHPLELVVVRDCIRAIRLMMTARKEKRAGFSILRALWEVARGKPRPDLSTAFWADVIHIFRGARGRSGVYTDIERHDEGDLEGREAALARSEELDTIWQNARRIANRYPYGLHLEAKKKRAGNRRRIMEALGATPKNWNDWRWQVRNVVRDFKQLERLVLLNGEEKDCIRRAVENGIPFGITPYYVSLMDNSLNRRADHAVRAQVIPDPNYVHRMSAHHGERERAFDFMLERDTSPVDLITRRYATIAIFKPYNTCPQICVYCQRNWEINEVLDKNALAAPDEIHRAVSWLRNHPSVTEVLVTGGDPLILSTRRLQYLLEMISELDHIQRIRIGTRTPVTLPMRINDSVADMLAGFRIPGRREVAVITHIEHSYELSDDLVRAVDRLKLRGIGVYNQMVFTFENSRRFEAAQLRRLLRLCGVDPYYTFNMKGKEETDHFRVPMARLLQEQKEEARILSGLDRADEAVYNVPRLGKNYLRAAQHRDIISILPDGGRVYEFHPWEKKMMLQETFTISDMAILPYLERLKDRGEDPEDYESIWYYF